MEDYEKKFSELQTPGSRLLFISLNMKKEGRITEEEHAKIKSSRGLTRMPVRRRRLQVPDESAREREKL